MNTGVGCHALLQGVFLTQGSNPGVPYCRWILCHLSPQGTAMASHEKRHTALLFWVLRGLREMVDTKRTMMGGSPRLPQLRPLPETP